MKISPHRKRPKTGEDAGAEVAVESRRQISAQPPGSRFTEPTRHRPVEAGQRPAPPQQVQVQARVVKTLFDGWLKVHEVEVAITRGGVETTTLHLKLLERPGHDSTHALTMKIHGDAPPTLVYKDGDTRPTAALRGTPYVAIGIIAGSLDHKDVNTEITALLEIAEEVGGRPLGRLIALGAPMATMEVTDRDGETASSEADHYYLAVLSDETEEIKGDGGGLEVEGLMKPVELSVADAVQRLDSGAVRENARARVAMARGFDKAGFVPGLNLWLRQLPAALRQRFDTLGLGHTWDARTATTPVKEPKEPAPEEAPKGPPPVPKNMQLAAQISDVDLGEPTALELGNGATMFSGNVHHLADDGTGQKVEVGIDIPINTLHVDYDRVKIAQYYVDPERGPMVRFEAVERPLRAAKAAMTGEALPMITRDLTDLEVPLPEVQIEDGRAKGAEGLEAIARARALETARAALPGATFEVLSAPSYASPGQSDLGYHFMAASVAAGWPGDFVPLAEALRACRATGEADANSEALLLRLADHLEWIPQLGMSKQEANRIIEEAAHG